MYFDPLVVQNELIILFIIIVYFISYFSIKYSNVFLLFLNNSCVVYHCNKHYSIFGGDADLQQRGKSLIASS